MRCPLTTTNIIATIADTQKANARASIFFQISATQCFKRCKQVNTTSLSESTTNAKDYPLCPDCNIKMIGWDKSCPECGSKMDNSYWYSDTI